MLSTFKTSTIAFGAVALLTAVFPLAAQAAPTTIAVTLADDGMSAAMPGDMGLGMPGADPQKGSMHVVASMASIPAGEVTFEVTNKSAETVHEMLVVKVPSTATPLPYDAAENAVDEDKAGSLGEVSELDPGMAGSLTLTLEPGTYVLFCNLPGHYMAGMWTLLTVS